jgi:hypothetical protein
MIKGILETYKCLISCRINMPGMKLEDAFSAKALRSLQEEYEWIKNNFKEANK